MDSTLFHLQWFVLVLVECSSQTRIWRSSWSQQSLILWNRTEGDNDQDWRRLNLIYFKHWVHIWAPFFCGPVSPCIHVPVVGHSSTVTSSLWLGEHWSNGDLQATWFYDIFWRVMGLSRKLRYDYLSRKNLALHHSSTLFLGQVISLVCWKSIMTGSIFLVLVDFQCSTRLRNLILHDLIGVMQSITARLNSFLHQTNNNLCYYRGRESNRAPRGGSIIYYRNNLLLVVMS
jgi:hypothetical protein